MAKFKVVEEYAEYVTKYYVVEAESEDEARQMVEDGDVGEDDYDSRIDEIYTSVEKL